MKPVRFKKARGDASVDTIQSTIESDYGLPTGSVRLLRPDGTPKRRDASIASLRTEYCDC
jgi:hypothetical protein